MTGKDFLKLASDLFARNRGSNEALCRTIVSRAYYGAFHVAREYVVDLGLPDFGHRALADSLIASGETAAVRAGDLLKDLATGRRKADYDLAVARVIQEVQDEAYLKDFIERANDVKSLLDQSADDEVRSRVKAGIEAYQRRSRKPNP